MGFLILIVKIEKQQSVRSWKIWLSGGYLRIMELETPAPINIEVIVWEAEIYL